MIRWLKQLFRKQQHQKGWRCPKCQLKRVFYGAPDPCLGWLPGLKYACCGHGKQDGGGYLYFINGKIIRFYGDIIVEEKK